MPINLTTYNGRDRWRNVEETVNALAPSAGDATFESIDGDLVFKTSRKERGRIKADGTKTGVFVSPSISVKDYGAAGDGVTDDSAAVQAAFNDVSTTYGGQVVFPPGKYNIGTAVVLPNIPSTSGMLRITGAGATLYTSGSNTILKRVTADVSTAAADIAGCQNWLIEGIRFEGASVVGSKGLEIHSSYNLNLRNCHFYRLGTGADFKYGLGLEVSNCTEVQCVTYGLVVGSGFGTWTGAPGVSVGYGCNGAVVRSWRSYCASGATAGIYVYNTSDAKVESGIFEGANPTYDILFDDAGSTVVKQFTVRNLHVENTPATAIVGWGGTGKLEVDQLFTEQAGVTWVDGAAGSGARSPGWVTFTNCPLFPASNKVANSNMASGVTWVLWGLGNADATDFKQAAFWSGTTPASSAIMDIKSSVFNWANVKFTNQTNGVTGNTALYQSSGDQYEITQGFFRLWDTAVSQKTFEAVMGGTRQIGFFGAAPASQQTAAQVSAGFSSVAGTSLTHTATFTGNTGATAYTIGDVVSALKKYGLLVT